MPSGQRIELFSDADLDRLAAAVERVLAETGFWCQSAELQRALAAAGAVVDEASGVVRVPPAMLSAVVAAQRRRQAAEPETARRPSPDGPLPGITLQVAQFYYDHQRHERRPGNRPDLVRMTQLGEALDDQPVSQVLLLRDQPALVEPLEGLAVLLEYTSRPGSVYPHFLAQFPYLEEIGQIYCGDPYRFLTGGIFMVSPLRMDERAGDYLAGRLRRGLSCGVGTMPVSGVSAPVTRAGAIVVGAADILAGWVAVHALDPERPLSGGICSGSVDMRTGSVSFSSPESMLQDVGCAELFRRRFGGGVGVAGGADYTSATYPGYQAGFEKAFEAMAIAAHTGEPPHLGAGLLDSGKTFSPLQLFIDRECQRMLWHYAAGVTVDDDTLALGDILAVGPGLGATHLESEHTLAHFRQSLWTPRLLDRQPGQEGQPQPDAALLARAQHQLETTLAAYQRPVVDRGMLAQVRQVIERAWKELL